MSHNCETKIYFKRKPKDDFDVEIVRSPIYHFFFGESDAVLSTKEWRIRCQPLKIKYVNFGSCKRKLNVLLTKDFKDLDSVCKACFYLNESEFNMKATYVIFTSPCEFQEISFQKF